MERVRSMVRVLFRVVQLLLVTLSFLVIRLADILIAFFRRSPSWVWWGGVITGLAVYFVTFLIHVGYTVEGTGFGEYLLPNGEYQPEKTLWDWLELILIPSLLTLGVFVLNQQAKQREQALAEDGQRESVLQAYIDHIEELLLEKQLASKDVSPEAKNVARVRTLTALDRLDTKRRSTLIRFLIEAQLIQSSTHDDVVISLAGANLEGTDLRALELRGADLRRANLCDADLRDADLCDADLRLAYLWGVNLRRARLDGAILAGVDRSEEIVQGRKLGHITYQWAIFNRYSILPDGRRWRSNMDMNCYTDPEHEDYWRITRMPGRLSWRELLRYYLDSSRPAWLPPRRFVEEMPVRELPPSSPVDK